MKYPLNIVQMNFWHFATLFGMLLLPAMAQAQLQPVVRHYERAAAASEEPIAVSFVQPEMRLLPDSVQLMQIMLMRHGEPALHKKGWATRAQAQAFVRAYDSVGIYPPAFTPATLQKGEIDTIYTSSLNRSKHTARLVFEGQQNYHADTLFREFERKVFSGINFKRPLKCWLVQSRVLWLLGLNDKSIESFAEAKRRTARAATRLESIAQRNGKAVLVSHGFLNRYLVKTLKKRGWTVAHNGGSEYLATWLLVKVQE